jgi:uncharacterized protein
VRVADTKIRILCLDGGGAKGFYTLGALREIEKLANGPLYQHFPLIYGTSTGSIIAALLALGHSVDDIYKLYSKHVPNIMRPFTPGAKTRALQLVATEVFKKRKFDRFKTDVGIVATNFDTETPMIFKTDVGQAYLGKDSFAPGFGCTIAEAVQASCSAYPFFKAQKITTHKKQVISVIDGGYCANNPTLYAIADALNALKAKTEMLRVVSIGVGLYPPPKRNPKDIAWWMNKYPGAAFFQKTLEINTQSMERLRDILYRHIPTVRISQAYTKPEMATDLLERDQAKLELLHARGIDSVREHELKLREFFA